MASSGDRASASTAGAFSRPASIAGLVRGASLALFAFHLAVAILVGIGGACLMQGALVLSGGEPRSTGAWIVASLAGLLAAAAWKLGHPVTEAASARALDRGLRLQGGLVAAFEARAEETGLRASLARLLEARLLARIEAPEAIRSTMPSIVLPIAAPLLGAALLALALEARGSARPATAAELAGLLGGLARSSTALSSELGASVDPASAEPDAREALALAERCAARAEACRETLAAADPAPEALAQAKRDGDSLDRDLARLSELLGGRADLRERVAEAQNALDAARRALDSAGTGAVASALPDASDVTRGARAGTMPGPVPDRPAPTERPRAPAEPARPERGAFAATSWPSEYDGIVSGWVERARRRAAESAIPQR